MPQRLLRVSAEDAPDGTVLAGIERGFGTVAPRSGGAAAQGVYRNCACVH
jgi:hypothetical protein